MKSIITVLITSFIFALNTFAQNNEVEVIAKSNCNQLAGDVFTVDIYLKALNDNETVTVSHQNYRFDFNIEALKNPSLASTADGLGYNNPVFANDGSVSFFEAPTLRGSLHNVVSFNVELAGGEGLKLTSEEATYIGSISFDVVNPGLPFNFNWHHFIDNEENWPPTFVGVKYPTQGAGGVFTDNIGGANIAAADFTRSNTHVCSVNDGTLSIAYPNGVAYNDLFISIDGGVTFTAAVSNPFVAEDLPVGDYDIKVKQGEAGCAITLDDVNIKDLSHEVSMGWEHPTCGNSNGVIELTWVKKALGKIDISINGGKNYKTVAAANEFYRFENLPKGKYDIRVKWTYAPFACATVVDKVNLQFSDQCRLGKNDINTIQIYPNPANQQVTINLEGTTFENGRVEVKINADGKEIYTQKLTIAH